MCVKSNLNTGTDTDTERQGFFAEPVIKVGGRSGPDGVIQLKLEAG